MQVEVVVVQVRHMDAQASQVLVALLATVVLTGQVVAQVLLPRK